MTRSAQGELAHGEPAVDYRTSHSTPGYARTYARTYETGFYRRQWETVERRDPPSTKTHELPDPHQPAKAGDQRANVEVDRAPGARMGGEVSVRGCVEDDELSVISLHMNVAEAKVAVEKSLRSSGQAGKGIGSGAPSEEP